MVKYLSDKRDRRVVHLLAAGVIFSNAGGNCLLRLGLQSDTTVASFSLGSYIAAFASTPVIVGILLLILWLFLQLTLLSWADLRYVLPVTSSSYVLTTFVGQFGLGEEVSALHWCGVLMILCGVVIVGRTPPLTTGSDTE